MQPTPPVTETPEVIRVQLKPIFGLSPRIWLPAFYALMVVIVLFFLTIWPGLARPGTKVDINSIPSGAAVVWNGKLYGQTPLHAFFQQGKGTLEVSKPGFIASSSNFVSGNSVIFSLFFPNSARLNLKLAPISQEAVIEVFRTQLAHWAAAAPFSEVYRFPPLFTQFEKDAQAASFQSSAIQSELLAERRFVVDPQMYQDYGAALGLGKTSSSGSLESQYNLWKSVLGPQGDDHGRLVFWILANQQKEFRDAQVNSPSDFFQKTLKQWQDSLTFAPEPNFVRELSLVVAGERFVGVPGGTFRWGFKKTNQSVPTDPPFDLPTLRTVSTFWLATHETTQAQYERFIKAVPEWNVSNKLALIKAHLVTEDYLVDWSDGRPPVPNAPVANVSWFAAQAYVKWLNATGQIPQKKEVVLPDEVQWEWAARGAKLDNQPIYQRGKPNSLGIYALQDGVWEWTASSWAPGDQLVDQKAVTDDSAWMRTLKGGCDINAGHVQVWERGVADAATCNPETGFRVALISSP